MPVAEVAASPSGRASLRALRDFVRPARYVPLTLLAAVARPEAAAGLEGLSQRMKKVVRVAPLGESPRRLGKQAGLIERPTAGQHACSLRQVDRFAAMSRNCLAKTYTLQVCRSRAERKMVRNWTGTSLGLWNIQLHEARLGRLVVGTSRGSDRRPHASEG